MSTEFKTTIKRFGGSKGVIIPYNKIKELNLNQGDEVSVTVLRNA